MSGQWIYEVDLSISLSGPEWPCEFTDPHFVLHAVVCDGIKVIVHPVMANAESVCFSKTAREL